MTSDNIENYKNTVEDASERKMTSDDIAYYRKIVEDTRERLLNLCDEWTREIEVNELKIGEEIVQRIHSVIGKSLLLRSSKFSQFEGFLNDAAGDTIGKPVNFDDIRGFWETINIQVEQVEKSFDELEKLRRNNYVESESCTVPDGVVGGGVKKPIRKKAAAAADCNKKPVASASRNLKNFILAQRERQKMNAMVDATPSNGHS